MNELGALITTLVTALNTLAVIYVLLSKTKREVKKMEADVETDNVETANLNLEGAKISGLILLDRVNELKGEVESLRTELDAEKQKRRDSMAQAEKDHNEQMRALEAARQADKEYFRRRIRDLERELSDYRSWAAKLVKQVVEAGKIPVPLVPSVNESQEGITAIRTELEGKADGESTTEKKR